MVWKSMVGMNEVELEQWAVVLRDDLKWMAFKHERHLADRQGNGWREFYVSSEYAEQMGEVRGQLHRIGERLAELRGPVVEQPAEPKRGTGGKRRARAA